LTQPVALLIGNEGRGLAAEVVAAATLRVHIPMPGNMESLNAASCGAIAMYELAQQRNIPASKTNGAPSSASTSAKRIERGEN
jgi:TrmH family RNA methyltransferase